jgi:hypothetical protein
LTWIFLGVESTRFLILRLDEVQMATIRIKPVSQLQDKYSRRAAAAAPDYADGVKNPKRDQAQAAIDAAATWAAGVQQAITNNAFAKGVGNAGSEKWARKATTVGAQRYPQGVQAAGPDWSKNVQPYLEAIANVNFPPRLPKGDPANINRVAAVNTALRALKLSRG